MNRSGPSGGWLYVRGNASVLIIKTHCALLVRGPGLQLEMIGRRMTTRPCCCNRSWKPNSAAGDGPLSATALSAGRCRIPRWTGRRRHWQN